MEIFIKKVHGRVVHHLTHYTTAVLSLLSILQLNILIHHQFHYNAAESFTLPTIINFPKAAFIPRIISINSNDRNTHVFHSSHLGHYRSYPSLIMSSVSLSETDKKSKRKKRKRKKNSIPIIACSSSIEMHRAIDMYLKPNDTIVELGAQLSDISAHICRKIGSPEENNGFIGGGHAVLVDIKRHKHSNDRSTDRDIDAFIKNENHNPQDCRNEDKSFIDIVDHFLEVDKLDQWRQILTLSPPITNNQQKKYYNYNAMVLDIGTMTGNDLSMTALTIAQEFLGFQRHNRISTIDEENDKATILPRVVIIKSKTLSTLARRLIHSQRLFDGTVELSSKNDIVSQQKEKKQEHEPFIIASVGVEEYRRTIPFIVDKEDEVLEVGCHFGRTTSILHSTASFCIGVDIGPKIIKTAKKQYPIVPFAVADAWRTLDLLKLKQQQIESPVSSSSSLWGYDIIYADIGGLSGPDGLLESIALIDSLSCALEPRCIVIKSLCMNRLASQLQAFSNIWNYSTRESSY